MANKTKPTRDLYAELMLKARERGIEYPKIREAETGELVVEDSLTGHQYKIQLVRSDAAVSLSRP